MRFRNLAIQKKTVSLTSISCAKEVHSAHMVEMRSKTYLIKKINMSAEENAKAYYVFSNVALAKGISLVTMGTVFFVMSPPQM